MRRVAEIMYIVPERREEFLKGALHPDTETEKVLWLCGVRKQLYFSLNDLIFMTFEYEGTDFAEDMKKMAFYLDGKNLLIKKRRKDVPVEEREITDWWAPVKRLGSVLETNPTTENSSGYKLMDILDGAMTGAGDFASLAYDEEDWIDDFHF